MTAPIFEAGERHVIESVTEECRLALTSSGLWPTSGTSLYLHHRRAAVLATRGWIGRKPKHAEVAVATLEWARGRGDVGLYATVAISIAVGAAFGDEGLDAAKSAYPRLGAGSHAISDLVRHLRQVLPSAVTPTATATSEG